MHSSNSSSTSLNTDGGSYPSFTNGKKPIKEGSVQLTSLSTLLSHHRYFFLFPETLIISKQKGACSFKLKEKLRLERIWVASSNTADSFLIGWPFTNYLVHFRNTDEKDEWFELLSTHVHQCTRPVFTTISMDINVRGRKQTIRRRVENGKKSGEIVIDTATDLGLPHTSYQLMLSVGDNSSRALQGPENVYVTIMCEIERQGIRLSESQKNSLDTCALVNCRLTLSTIKSAASGPSPRQIVNSIKRKVLARSDGRSIFGKELNGPTPPQPIMTIVDHLRMDGYNAEGIFRKSPKQSTFKELKSELDKGVVPDFHKYNAHVLASILKEYLRGIPGKILLSGNYELWMNHVADEVDVGKKIVACRGLLSHLPTSHSILLANVLKLLNKISEHSETSKMSASSLSVCLAPSFLDSPDPMEGGKKIPPLVEFLITNAAQVVPGFSTDNVFAIMSQPTDLNANVVCSPVPSSSHSDDGSSQRTPIIEELHDDDATSQSSIAESEELEQRANSNTSHLDTISEMTEPPPDRLVFSSSDDETAGDDDDEDDLLDDIFHRRVCSRPSFSRASFISETLRSTCDELPPPPVPKTETPRSPCLKRIHFQRTEAQHRTKEGSIKLDFEALKYHRKSSIEEACRLTSTTPTPRKESREEATQTPDCGLPMLGALRTNVKDCAVPADPTPPARKENDYKPISANEPTSLKSINERLKALRQNSLGDLRSRSIHPPEPIAATRLRNDVKSLQNSPVMIRNPPSRDLHRSSSQRSNQRQDSFSNRKPTRRFDRETCVGMDPLEINWSVSHLKTLFQDTKAPSINTVYTQN